MATTKKQKEEPEMASENGMAEAIASSILLRPKSLLISDLKWRTLVHAALRGMNLLLTGATGTGKTVAVRTVAKALGRPFFYFNIGDTIDPRQLLIGTTHFVEGEGTVVTPSEFIQAIRTEGAIILLDELTRGSGDAWNILMSITDPEQRYLRINESPESPKIFLAEDVCFFATANIGMEYTATRQLDEALLSRFDPIEMEYLEQSQQATLLKYKFPELDDAVVNILAEVYAKIKDEYMSGSGRLSRAVSTRTLGRCAMRIQDGFSVKDALEVSVTPLFSSEGGVDSERTFIMQMIQKYDNGGKLKGDNMFE